MMYTLATFFNIVLEVLVMAIREEERKLEKKKENCHSLQIT